MGHYRLVTLPGDGVGPEVTAQALRVIEVLDRAKVASFAVDEIPCGGSYFEAHGAEWPPGSFERCRDADAVFLGAVGHSTPSGEPVRRADGELAGYEMVIGMRLRLDLYANVRPVKLYDGVRHKISGRFTEVWDAKNVDMVIIRENTEDAYTTGAFRLERGGATEVVVSPTMITRKGAERVARFAFETARRRTGAPADHARRVTCVDKSNVIQAHRFFRQVFREVAADYPDVATDFAYVDAFTQWLVRSPENFDVVVAPNFPGDVVTDLGSVLQGGMGLAAGGNVGDGHAMFEPIHGSAPKYTGQDKVNPIAAILAMSMLIDWLGRRRGDEALARAAAAIEASVAEVIARGATLTYDLGGSATCSAVGKAVSEALGRRL